MTRDLKVLGTLLSVVFALSSVSAQAQTKSRKKKAATDKEVVLPAEAPPKAGPVPGVKLTPGEVLNFRVDDSPSEPGAAAEAPRFQFTDGETSAMPETPAGFTGGLPEDVPFRTYIGYPKHKIMATVEPKNVAATWTLNSFNFNFRNSTVAYGAGYEFAATPRLAVGIDYSHYDLSVNGGDVNPYRIAKSDHSYDVYLANLRYCFFGSSSFFQQICPGITFGSEAYPILEFSNGSNLKLGGAQSLVTGVNISYFSPITDKVLFRALAGYNFGSGTGNTGSATPSNHSTYYLRLGAGYEFNRRHSVVADVDWFNRSTTLKDRHGNVSDSWTIKSTDLGLRMAYVLTL